MTDYSRSGAVFGRTEMAWQDRAACRDADASLFFAPEVERASARKRREAAAKAICSGCTVRTACLDWRLDFPDQGDGGVWGGAGEDERARIRRLRLRAATRRAAA